tara:strand:+ start:322 stop:543 length:222 start_codon:yes stop_codon:yes gene_type:complete
MSQKHNWVVLKSNSQAFELEMMKGFLLENGIDSIIMNKKDSSYQMFGESELMIKEEDLHKANELLNSRDERNA